MEYLSDSKGMAITGKRRKMGVWSHRGSTSWRGVDKMGRSEKDKDNVNGNEEEARLGG
ncbi:MAG: hypothetical protein KJ907_08665 [Actinobacteria bacterium]|nr:hypothetical protein [Actinomycetota bacterium]MBU4402788.1 hypothetical protein [Actinomycetota bacterium]MBU4442982.1 hypothetical protein [Actinomycetota bacterium]